MRRKPTYWWRWIALAIPLGAAVLWLLHYGGVGEGTAGLSPLEGGPHKPPSMQRAGGGKPGAEMKGAFAAGFEDGIKTALAEDSERPENRARQEAVKWFLAERGRTAENLAIAYRVLRDAGYLEEALGRDPNNLPALFMAMRARFSGDPADVLRRLRGGAEDPATAALMSRYASHLYQILAQNARIHEGTYGRERAERLAVQAAVVDRLRKLEPDNALWCIEEAGTQIQTGDKPAALAAIRMALSLNSLRDPTTLLVAAEEAFRREYLHNSYSESITDTELAVTRNLGCDFYSVHNYLRSGFAESGFLGGSDEANEFAALGLSIGLLQARLGSIQALRSGAAAEEQLLREFTENAAGNAPLDRPLAAYRQDVSVEVRLAEQLSAYYKGFVETASEAELKQYVESRNRVGQVAALKKLLAESETTVRSE